MVFFFGIQAFDFERQELLGLGWRHVPAQVNKTSGAAALQPMNKLIWIDLQHGCKLIQVSLGRQ